MENFLLFFGGFSILIIAYAIIMIIFPFIIWNKLNKIIDRLETIEYIKKQEYINENPNTED